MIKVPWLKWDVGGNLPIIYIDIFIFFSWYQEALAFLPTFYLYHNDNLRSSSKPFKIKGPQIQQTFMTQSF